VRFAFLLARTLGCTVHELAQRMTAYEFGQWQALFMAEPWGEVRGDVAAGVVASTIANVNRSGSSKAFTPLDFCPYLKPREEPTTVQNAREMFRGRNG
jgi:hypothetical protein